MRGMVWRPPSPVRRQLGRSARGGGPVSRLRRKRPASPTPQAPQSARPGTFSARETRSAAGDDRCAAALHLRVSAGADEVLVVGDCIGDSTRAEIAYARSLGKPVRFTHPQGDPDA